MRRLRPCYAEDSSQLVSAPVLIALVAESGGSTDIVPLTPRLFGAPRWSPDGRSVAYFSGEGVDLNIFTYDLELGTIPRQLTFQLVRGASPADGQ